MVIAVAIFIRQEAERLHRGLSLHRTGMVCNIEKVIRTGYVQQERKRPAGEFYRCIVGFIQKLVPEVAEGPLLSFKEIAAARRCSYS